MLILFLQFSVVCMVSVLHRLHSFTKKYLCCKGAREKTMDSAGFEPAASTMRT